MTQTAEFEVLTELSEWWIQSHDGSVIRIWASAYSLADGKVIFNMLVKEGDATRVLELAVVPQSSIQRSRWDRAPMAFRNTLKTINLVAPNKGGRDRPMHDAPIG